MAKKAAKPAKKKPAAKKASRKPKARTPRPKQQRLAGMPGGEKHPDVSKAADAYVEARDARMEQTKDEVATRDTLVLKMREHGLAVYRDPDSDLVVTLIEGKVKVKVRHENEPDEGDVELKEAVEAGEIEEVPS